MTSSSIQVICREYEHELSARDPTSDAQLLRVRQLYHRQLQVPLAEAAQTMQSYLKWEASLPHAQQAIQAPSHVQQGFQKAQQAVSLRHEHEAMVAPDKPADENLLAAFLAYIKYEEVGCFASTSRGLCAVCCLHRVQVTHPASPASSLHRLLSSLHKLWYHTASEAHHCGSCKHEYQRHKLLGDVLSVLCRLRVIQLECSWSMRGHWLHFL